ncbi:MAG: ATP-binding cassette domain-containing protein [Saprospiraceae bacterium]
MSLATQINTMTPLQRFFKLLQLDKKEISYIYLYAIFAGLITLTLPLGIQAIIGLIIGGNVSSSWVLLIIVVTLGTLLNGVLKVMQLSVTETIQQRIFTRSAFDIAYRFPRIKFEAVHTEFAPELANRFFDTLTLQKGLPKILMDFSTGLLQIFFGLLLLSFYHPLFIAFGLLLLLIVAIIFRFTGPQGLKTSLVESKYKYKVAYWLEELARTMGTFKLAGRSELPMKRTDKLVGGYLNARKQHFRVLITQYYSIVAFKVIVTAGLLVLGSLLVIDNRINIGQFVAAEIIIILVLASVEKLILTMESIYDVLTALEKIGALHDLPIDDEDGIPFEKLDSGKGMAVDLEGVSFKFPDAEKPTLNDINLSIVPGEKLCISGYNRAGKSTLLQILTGIFSDFKGSLRFNNIPIRNIDGVSLRAHVGDHMPLQEDIFQGTLMENISLGHDKVGLEDVMFAVKQVGLMDFVNRLPDGYDTQLLPGGKNLPRSVVAKIILARSFASKPLLLAIEEPFQHLDYKEQVRLAGLLTDRNSPWTLVVVSNDPMLASMCDRVVVMREGSIVEEGNFEKIKTCEHFRPVFEKPQMTF